MSQLRTITPFASKFAWICAVRLRLGTCGAGAKMPMCWMLLAKLLKIRLEVFPEPFRLLFIDLSACPSKRCQLGKPSKEPENLLDETISAGRQPKVHQRFSSDRHIRHVARRKMRYPRCLFSRGLNPKSVDSHLHLRENPSQGLDLRLAPDLELRPINPGRSQGFHCRCEGIVCSGYL